MTEPTRKQHWESVYASKGVTEVSWYQKEPRLSLKLIRKFAPFEGGRIIDVGGGASVLVDGLLNLGFERVAVLDVSETALEKARERLGERAREVAWITADVTVARDLGTFDLWHDRAVFHFLTDENDRRKYVELAMRCIPAGGHMIVATFADDGPAECSRLPVRRYNAASMAAELGRGFALVEEARELHPTPLGSSQSFFYGVFERIQQPRDMR